MSPRVLVVDDEPDTLVLIKLTLRRRGYEVQTAASGAEALELIERDLPDLILLDLMMPAMDGFEVLKRLRGNPRTAPLPVIIFTATLPVGTPPPEADDYVNKPVDPDHLVRCIRGVLERKATADAPTSKGYLIGVVGCKGGVGTTSVATNVALALSSHERVVLADFVGDAMVYLGQSPFDWPVTLSKLDVERIDRQAVEHAWVPYLGNLHLLYDARLLAHQGRVRAVLNCLTDMVNFGVLDLGTLSPGVQANKQWILESCKAIILVVAPGRVETEHANRILKQLAGWGIAAPVYPVWVVRSESNPSLEAASLEESLARQVIIIPYSSEPLFVSLPGAPAAQALRELVNLLKAA